jgi:site-specific DNA-methyltransferase (cytosine-N4-specific)
MRPLFIQADARFIPLADLSIQCCVTSPPYWGLRDYGITGQLGTEPTPSEYVSNMVVVFREVWRVLRQNGLLWLNLGDSYHNVRTHNNGGVPTNTVHRGGSRDGMENFTRHNRNKKLAGLKEKDLIGIPWRVALALQADGWYLRSDIIWSKPNPMPERVVDRPTKSHEYVFMFSKSTRYLYHAKAITDMSSAGDSKRNARSVWTINTQSYHGVHFATMPETLARRCILAGSSAGDLVLDPFVGSGAVTRSAIWLGRKAVGCDLNMRYLTIARERSTVTAALPLDIASESIVSL